MLNIILEMAFKVGLICFSFFPPLHQVHLFNFSLTQISHGSNSSAFRHVGRDDLLKFKLSMRMRKSDFKHSGVVAARRAGISETADLLVFSHTNICRFYRR